MAQPLYPLSPAAQNLRSPPSIERDANYTSRSYEPQSYIIHEDTENDANQYLTDTSNLPLLANVDIENHPPIKGSISAQYVSPKKTSSGNQHGLPLTENALRENEGLAKNTSGDERKQARSRRNSDLSNESMSIMGGPQGYPGADDTCLSTFSAVPNTDMTLFAQIGQSAMSSAGSPPKSSRKLQYRRDAPTPRRSRPTTPSTTRRRDYDASSPCSSPTPRRHEPNDSGDTTNLILDFTEQFSALHPGSQRSPTRSTRPSPTKSQTQPDLAAYASELRAPPTKQSQPPRTPAEARKFANLLDFDLTPAPTPRSVPTITVREVETLKSSFLSQISSLRATLSGKEAEINSLKEAIGDAECRVGEAMEEAREQRGAKEGLELDKIEWEKRDKEMQGILRDVKGELVRGEREREELKAKADESEKRREEAEARAADAQSRLAGVEAGSAASGASGDASTPGSGSNKAVEAAVENVARELHTLYKTKHENKVGALKKSYEARWEKRIKELQAKVDEVSKENEDLKIGRDATMSGLVPGTLTPVESDEQKHQRIAEAQRREEEQQAKLATLAAEVETVKNDNAQLRIDLEKERLEKGDLVAAAEEILSLQASAPPVDPPAVAGSDTLRGSISRASGLKGPGFSTSSAAAAPGESRIGLMSMRSTSGGVRSGMMSNIERMGRGRGAE